MTIEHSVQELYNYLIDKEDTPGYVLEHVKLLKQKLVDSTKEDKSKEESSIINKRKRKSTKDNINKRQKKETLEWEKGERQNKRDYHKLSDDQKQFIKVYNTEIDGKVTGTLARKLGFQKCLEAVNWGTWRQFYKGRENPTIRDSVLNGNRDIVRMLMLC